MGFVIPPIPAAISAIGGAIGTVGAAGAAASATTIAGTAVTLGQVGTALSVAGSLYGGISGYEAGKYQAKVLNMQAAYQDRQADNSRIAGSRKESAIKAEISRTIGAQRAAEAGNGVDVGVGSAVDIADSTRLEGMSDVAVAHYQAMQEAYGHQQEAWSARAGASAAKASARNSLIEGVLGAGASFLGGSSSLAKKKFGFDAAGLGGKGMGYSSAARSGMDNLLSQYGGA